MSDDSNIDEKLFDVDGAQLKVFVGVSLDRKHIEYVIESEEPISPIHVAKVLEVLGSNMLRGVTVPAQIYAKEMH